MQYGEWYLSHELSQDAAGFVIMIYSHYILNYHQLIQFLHCFNFALGITEEFFPRTLFEIFQFNQFIQFEVTSQFKKFDTNTLGLWALIFRCINVHLYHGTCKCFRDGMSSLRKLSIKFAKPSNIGTYFQTQTNSRTTRLNPCSLYKQSFLFYYTRPRNSVE